MIDFNRLTPLERVIAERAKSSVMLSIAEATQKYIEAKEAYDYAKSSLRQSVPAEREMLQLLLQHVQDLHTECIENAATLESLGFGDF